MKLTRRVLQAANAQLSAQLAAHGPETRKQLRANLAAAREDVKRLTAENERLAKCAEELIVKES